jgi:hypothetical protein
LRKIFGPVQNENGSRRIGMNYDLNELIENAASSKCYGERNQSETCGLEKHRKIIRAISLHAWTLTNRDEQLRIFERRILRKIFGPVQNENGSRRIRMNYDLNELIENADTVRFVKSRIAWLGHLMRTDDKRTPKRIREWKPTSVRIRGRPRKR